MSTRLAFIAAIGTVAINCLSSQVRVFSSSKQQFETSIAINPTNPKNIIAVAITKWAIYDQVYKSIGGYYSVDGGTSWSGSDTISPRQSPTDPLIAFDPLGIAYCVYCDVTNNDVVCQKSLDGGITWSNPVQVFHPSTTGYGVDRPSLAVSAG